MKRARKGSEGHDAGAAAGQTASGRTRWTGRALLVLAAAMCGASSPEGRDAAPVMAVPEVTSFGPALAADLMTPPLEVTGGFCEYRRGHFHGGFDFSSARRVGRAVMAPAGGWIERVRASGVGYGRSIYLHTHDGRLLVFAHLDAYAEPLASYVRAAQDSTGVYEQDLWLEAKRFPVAAGETLAWTGESGAGGPHLHFEIRRGDIAYHPQRAGLAVADTAPPSLWMLTLEPLDPGSRVAGGAGPRTFRLDRTDTLDVIGRVRAIVGARDGVWSGVDRMVPWEVGMEWAGQSTMCRFDSVSWATDMEEGDLVFDAGRVRDTKGVVLWSRAGYRPRVLKSDAPLTAEAGNIVVRKGDLPRTLRLWARDLGGGRAERRLVVRPTGAREPSQPAAIAADAADTGAWADPPLEASTDADDGVTPKQAKPGDDAEGWSDPPLTFTGLPGGAVRLTLPTSRTRRAVDFRWGTESRAATRGAGGWSAVLAASLGMGEAADHLELGWRQKDENGKSRAWRGRVQARRASPARELALNELASRREARFPAGALFESATIVAFTVPAQAARELEPVGDGWRIEPASLPMRRSAVVSTPVPTGIAIRGLGLYRGSGEDWQWIGGADDTTVRRISATSRQLGTFALFRDALAPRVPGWNVARDTERLPYSRWAFEATVDESGSGVAARACWFEVDGRRVPTEWDPEAGRLRWRPAAPPAPGPHKVVVVAADRAGNVARVDATFTAER